MKTSRIRAGSAFVGILIALLLVGCSGGGSNDSSDSGGDPAMDMAEPAAADVPMEDGALAVESAGGDSDDGSTSVSSDLTGQARAVIATGTMTLRADDLGATRISVRKVLDTYRGEIAQEETETDDKGELTFARVVLRIPSDSFLKAMDDLEAITKYNTRTTGSEDVTTQVIDIDARVQAQTKSLARIEALLAEASTFKDVVAIETQLTSRQAELESCALDESAARAPRSEQRHEGRKLLEAEPAPDRARGLVDLEDVERHGPSRPRAAASSAMARSSAFVTPRRRASGRT